METKILLLLKKKIDFELKKRYHISNIPFDVISKHILIHLDSTSIVSFLYVMKSSYENESDYKYHIFLNFIIVSLYDSIYQYANFMFTTCRDTSIRHIFSHWTPFSKRNIRPIATLMWSKHESYTSVDINHNIVKRYAKNLVKRQILQCRLSIHEQTLLNNFYTFRLNDLKFQQYNIKINPLCIVVADPFKCIFSNEHISLSKITNL